MTIAASRILQRAQITLQDDGTRWPLPELLMWINDAVREMTLSAPESVAQPIVLTLAAGARQTLPAAVLSILRVTCNIGADGTTRGAGVTTVQKDDLDGHMPGWQSPTVVPYAALVGHYIEDDAHHRTFLVWPGNTGTGRLEVLAVSRATEIAEPTSPLVLASYNAIQIQVDEIYQSAVTDYVLAKAFQKDTNLPNGGPRAEAHYKAFLSALGIRQTNEQRVNPATEKKTAGPA